MIKTRELRSFGLLLAVVFGAIASYQYSGSAQWPPLWTGLTLFFGGCALIWPRALKPIYRVWMKIGHVLGRINSTILLSLVFFLIVTPIGVLRRLTVRSFREVFTFRRNVDSYWIARTSDEQVASNMKQPF